MHISSLTIRNYRNFRNAKLLFKKGINTIIGENGSGKTNLFNALRLLIDDSLPRYTKFYQNDFNRSLENWAGNWIIISIDFDELDLSEEAQALAVHITGDMEKAERGSYSLYFRPKYEFRKQLYDYSQSTKPTKEGLKLVLDTINLDSYETVFLCRASGDFSDDNIYKKYVGDFENIIFPNPENKEEDIYGTWLPREINIHNEISCTFIKALRDVENDLKNYNNPLVNLFRGKGSKLEVTKQKEIIDSIEELNQQITSLDEVKEIVHGLDRSIKEAVGTTYAPNIDIKSGLPNEIETLFQSLKLWVGDPDEEGYSGKIGELSLGGANLIYLSMKLLEYEKLRNDKIANFLLIEEPEAHIHTHIQKTLFSNLKKKSSTQVIISTHSTHISSVSKIRSVNILSRGCKSALVFNPSNYLEKDEIIRLERYLDAVRSNLLFAKGVVLVEGDAEQILIPEMFKKSFGISLDEIGVSLINIGSTGFENVANIFHSDRIQKNCAILTDSDKSVIALSKKDSDDDDKQKHYRLSQKNGIERKEKLDKYCKDNIYLKTFYSDYTFEVDFLMAGNSFEIKNVIDNIYKTETKRNEIKEKINNKSVEIAGDEILRLANRRGKGWFALFITDQLVYNTYFPEYILKAIAFSSKHINNSTIAKSILYRLEKISSNDSDSNKDIAIKVFKSIKDKTSEEIIDKFKENLGDDQLAWFIDIL
jgi:putative ATP-dependent endonuclease of the OLD family